MHLSSASTRPRLIDVYRQGDVILSPVDKLLFDLVYEHTVTNIGRLPTTVQATFDAFTLQKAMGGNTEHVARTLKQALTDEGLQVGRCTVTRAQKTERGADGDPPYTSHSIVLNVDVADPAAI